MTYKFVRGVDILKLTIRRRIYVIGSGLPVVRLNILVMSIIWAIIAAWVSRCLETTTGACALLSMVTEDE